MAQSGASLIAMSFYLGASLLAAPVEAWRLQMAVLLPLKSSFQSHPAPYCQIYEQIMPGAIIRFWRTTVDEQSFYFSHPNLTRTALREALGRREPDEQLMRKVLSDVADGLRLRPAADQKLWLTREKEGETDKV